MATFGERLRTVRNMKGITLDKLAEDMQTTKATLSRYENNLREPKTEFAKRLADYFDVSLDYLLGITDNMQSVNPKNEPELTAKDRKDIAKNLEDMLNNIETVQGLEFYNQPQDEEDMEFIKRGLEKFLEDVKIYNKVKYNPNKYRGKK